MDLHSLFQNSSNVQEFQTGTTIFTEGAPRDVMYVILDGEVEVGMRGRLVEVLGPGEIVGEMALIDASPRSASVVAKSACRLAPVDERRFLRMISDTPFFALHVMRVLVGRVRRRMASGE